MSAFSPQRVTSSIPVPQEIALRYLQAYLEASETTPHLLPNARLEQSGPTAGNSNGSVALHNLRRVEAGLRGVHMEMGIGEEEVGGEDEETGGEWTDMTSYQRAQTIEEREMGVGTEMGKGAFEPAEEDLPALPSKKLTQEGAIDKQQRKLEKKARLKLEKKQKEKQRQAAQ